MNPTKMWNPIRKSFKLYNNHDDSIYESPYIYETLERYMKPYSDNDTNDESEFSAYNKHLQAVCEIAKRYVELYFESRKQNLKQRFYICVLVVILILLVMVQIISLFFLLEKWINFLE